MQTLTEAFNEHYAKLTEQQRISPVYKPSSLSVAYTWNDIDTQLKKDSDIGRSALRALHNAGII